MFVNLEGTVENDDLGWIDDAGKMETIKPDRDIINLITSFPDRRNWIEEPQDDVNKDKRVELFYLWNKREGEGAFALTFHRYMADGVERHVVILKGDKTMSIDYDPIVERHTVANSLRAEIQEQGQHHIGAASSQTIARFVKGVRNGIRDSYAQTTGKLISVGNIVKEANWIIQPNAGTRIMQSDDRTMFVSSPIRNLEVTFTETPKGPMPYRMHITEPYSHNVEVIKPVLLCFTPDIQGTICEIIYYANDRSPLILVG